MADVGISIIVSMICTEFMGDFPGGFSSCSGNQKESDEEGSLSGTSLKTDWLQNIYIRFVKLSFLHSKMQNTRAFV
mgnify:CR=1 FL=1